MIDAAATKWVIDVGDEGFEQEVVERSKQVPVVLDFWAPWCGPCKTLGPLLEKIAEAKAGAFVLAKVNIDEAQELASYFRVEGIPTVHAIRDGQFIPGFTGIPTEEEMKAFFDQLSPSETDNAIKEAQGLEAAQPEQAEKIYRSVCSKQPENELARVGLARLLVAQHKRQEASELLAPLGVSGDVGTEAERLRRIIELEGDSPTTADEATLRQKISVEPENAELRYQLGSLLAAQGSYPDALEMLLSSAERDKKLAQNQVRELMVKIFQIIGVRSEMADDYRDKLRALLY